MNNIYQILLALFFVPIFSLQAAGEDIKEYCQVLDKEFKKYSWGDSHCQSTSWIFVRKSLNNFPIMWATFGLDAEAPGEKDITLIMCGVHGDEITPIKFCFDIIENAKTNHENYVKDKRVVLIAPLVNPDSFIIKKPTRTNSRGVDVNRNFPTIDWAAKAQRIWKNINGKDPRRYPGDRPLSEAETIFQVNLIRRYKPNKIISVHAPLTLLDYDGPEKITANFKNKKSEINNIGKSANSLLIEMGQKAKGYKIRDFPFFPGSLGNWAGNERKIPTFTLELPSSDSSKTAEYWALFKEAIDLAITSNLKILEESN